MSLTVQRTCHCGKEFTAKKADVDRGWANSCSKSCASTARERKLDRNNYRGVGRARHPGFRHYRDEDREPTFANAHQFDNCEL